MFKECGYWIIDMNIKERWGFRYYLAKHKCNPVKIEIVFINESTLRGRKDLVDAIKEVNDE